MRISLRQCRYFQAVAKSGSIAAAADQVGVTQPAIAQAIAKLEDTTGLRLFDRLHARGMQLTPQGTELLRYAEQLLVYAGQMDQAASDIALNRQGTLRVGCFQSLAPFFLPQILSGYQKHQPGVVLQLSERLQHDLTNALQKDDLDCVILYDLGLDARLFKLHPLTTLRPYLIAPKGHKLTQLPEVSVRDLDGEDFILFDAPQSREYYYAQFAQYDIKPRIAFRSASIETVRSYVAHGLGVSILSMRPASDVTYDGAEVVPVRLKENFGSTRIVLASHADREVNPLVPPFISFCQQLFQDL
ncbi:LysR family transcriptional regulator [Tropicibacter sp. R16_0]|uniref:LysR family transcriptional regulator n=1 Tax=Tropicibacter sp. R16_0 TaxID=2821102 RepID=UPI001ADB51DD|nr:LysR family transcriptional regulator [Tropicibacter sp. R16_0]MBO9449217.1 LysR family transcriptional regulator [Tropicibacter sp. R16_0]